MSSTRLFSSLVVCFLLLISAVCGDDWPTWRHDAGRSAATSESLPAELFLQWTAAYPAPKPAWPDPRLRFDEAFQPVICGKTLFFGSSSRDCLAALDTETGGELWRFYAEGPIRVAPAVDKGKVYFTSDDGNLYCLDAANGKLLWKFFGGPDNRKVIGNERMISMWPARGGPVIQDGAVYFASGIWPFMGIFIYALDAQSGHILWSNEGTGTVYIEQSWEKETAFGGASPQGSLVISGQKLLIPAGRALPVFVDRSTGAMDSYMPGFGQQAGGDSRVCAQGDLIITGGKVVPMRASRPITISSSARGLLSFSSMPVVEKDEMYGTTPKAIEARRVDRSNLASLRSAGGEQPLWSIPSDKPIAVLIKAGQRLYAGRAGEVLAVDFPSSGRKAEVSWKGAVEGVPAELAVADGKLFVSTKEGKLYCFGGKRIDPVMNPKKESPPSQNPDSWTRKAEEILKRTGARDGYCYVLGIETGRLAEELVRQSNLYVLAVEPDSQKVEAFRKRLADLGLLGDRAAVFEGSALDFGFPQYMASLIVSEHPESAGLDSMGAFAKKIYPALRPYGGTLCLDLAADQQAKFATVVEGSKLEKARLDRDGSLLLVSREGALPGAADWPEEKGPGNTLMSHEKLVRAPLGVLWFGGPAGDPGLYRSRHSDPPAPRVCDGRMFIHGDKIITAVDSYTGRVLWTQKLPPVKAFSNRRSYVEGGVFPEQNGAKPATAQLLAHHDGLYVAYGTLCQLWQAETGETLKEFKIPEEQNGKEDLYWGYIKLWEDVLIAGAQYSTKDVESAFVGADFAGASEGDARKLLELLKRWSSTQGLQRAPNESDRDFIARSFNRLLVEDKLDATLFESFKTEPSLKPEAAEAVRGASAEIQKFRSSSASSYSPYFTLESLNRRLLEAYFPWIRKNQIIPYWHNLFPWDGAYTQQIVGLDRKSGNALWRRKAKYSFPQESIVVGNGKVFCLDRIDPDVEDYMKRRGLAIASEPRVLALDARTGEQLWSDGANVLGYQMFYSAEHDVLVRVNTSDPEAQKIYSPQWANRYHWWMSPRPLSIRFIACRGQDGKVLWDYTLQLTRAGGGHRMWYNWFLHKDTIVLESYLDGNDKEYSEYYGFNIMTGQRKTRLSPVTGAEVPWGFKRTRGCGKNLSCENLVLFRSTTAGYYDIANDGGTGNISGGRTGCKNSLIPACGILNSPNYASGCVCNFPIYTAMALAHMDDVESWTTNDYAYDGGQVERIGINLGAPGDRRADSGTLWLDYPSVGGASPDIPVKVEPANPRWYYRNSSRLKGEGLKWVGASGVEGLQTLTLTLCGKTPVETEYTVRLYFAEPADVKPGARVFSVALQGKTVLDGLDVLREAGGPDRVLVKEFKGVKAAKELTLGMKAQSGKTLLSGVELVAQKAP